MNGRSGLQGRGGVGGSSRGRGRGNPGPHLQGFDKRRNSLASNGRGRGIPLQSPQQIRVDVAGSPYQNWVDLMNGKNVDYAIVTQSNSQSSSQANRNTGVQNPSSSSVGISPNGNPQQQQPSHGSSNGTQTNPGIQGTQTNPGIQGKSRAASSNASSSVSMPSKQPGSAVPMQHTGHSVPMQHTGVASSMNSQSNVSPTGAQKGAGIRTTTTNALKTGNPNVLPSTTVVQSSAISNNVGTTSQPSSSFNNNQASKISTANVQRNLSATTHSSDSARSNNQSVDSDINNPNNPQHAKQLNNQGTTNVNNPNNPQHAKQLNNQGTTNVNNPQHAKQLNNPNNPQHAKQLNNQGTTNAKQLNNQGTTNAKQLNNQGTTNRSDSQKISREQLEKRLLETCAKLGLKQRRSVELEKENNKLQGTIKILRDQITNKDMELNRIRSENSKQQQTARSQTSQPDIKNDYQKIQTQLGFALKEKNEVIALNKRLRRQLDQVRGNSNSKRPRLDTTTVDNMKNDGQDKVPVPSGTTVGGSPIAASRVPSKENNLNNVVVTLLEESIEDVLVLLRFSAPTGTTSSYRLRTNGQGPVTPTSAQPQTPPPTSVRSQRRFEFNQTVIPSGDRRSAATVDRNCIPNESARQLISNLTPTLDRNRLSRTVPSPFSFAMASSANYLAGIESTDPGTKLTESNGWGLAVRLYRCLFRLLNGITSYDSLLEAVSAYLNPAVNAPISVLVSAVHVLLLVLNTSPQFCRHLLLDAETSSATGPNSGRKLNSAAENAARAWESLVESGKVQGNAVKGNSQQFKVRRVDRTEQRLRAASQTAAAFQHCVQLLSTCVQIDEKDSLTSSTPSSQRTICRVRSQGHLKLILPLIQFFTALVEDTSFHSCKPRSSPLSVLAESPLLGQVLSALLKLYRDPTHNSNGARNTRLQCYVLESATRVVELVGVLAQRNPKVSEITTDKEMNSHGLLPTDIFYRVFARSGMEVSEITKNAFQNLELCLLRYCFALISDGRAGVEWLTSHTSMAAKSHGIVRCLIHLLYRSVPSGGTQGSQNSYNAELVRQGFSLMLVILRATCVTPNDSWDIVQGANVDTDDVRLLTTVLVYLRDMQVDPSFKDVAVKAAQILDRLA